ncbi:MAG: hypothetical protein U9Q81_15055 [Pseudomonadota bacterium]|nr:hypothetical protein [Pseudomonadota bacterium]
MKAMKQVPPPPADLSAAGVAAWKDACRNFIDTCELRRSDLPLISAFSAAVDAAERVRGFVAKIAPHDLADENGRAHPMLAELRAHTSNVGGLFRKLEATATQRMASANRKSGPQGGRAVGTKGLPQRAKNDPAKKTTNVSWIEKIRNGGNDAA